MRILAATLTALCLVFPAAARASPPPAVAWVSAANDADIANAFAQARAENKPVVLYWGATWCPPCNQLKATLFNRQDFALEARSVVAVHVDGDLPGAQKLGQRFKVSGYPTLVLFNADGTEITRLPGEVDAPQVLALMRLGLAGGRPVKAVLADAEAGRPLTANEWRMLAFYSWDTDDDELVPHAELAGLLAKLAAACPPAEGEAATRLWLKALAANDEGKPFKPDAALRERVQRVLADPQRTRLYMDVIANDAADIVRALAEGDAPAQSPLVPQFDAALKRLASDATLSRGDRQSATISRIDLARLGLDQKERHPRLPEALLAQLREQAARDDREITDAYERQAVIPGWGYALGLAGLWSESDALLESNLARSHAPYYLMIQLAGNARDLGHVDAALRWYAGAFDRSEGPATRLQWGSYYLSALVDLAPGDAATIEKTATELFAEAAKDPGAFDGRSARSMKKIGGALATWNGDGTHAATIRRLQSRLDGLCAKVASAEGRRAACIALMKPKKAA
jgi:thioredoxin-related protein